jgi:hypothetical protein
MVTWIEDLAQYLEDSTTSIGIFTPTTTEARTIYCNNLPGSTASLIVLYPYAGIAPEYQMDGENFRKPRLNVIVRSTSADGGHQKSIDIRTRLDHVTNLALPTSSVARQYVRIEALNEPEYLGRDEHGRGQFVTNFQVEYINTT